MATVDFSVISNEDSLARDISLKWDTWNGLRSKWLDEKKELRNYLYATDTSTTSNNANPWSNKTTRPKLTSIMDNLHANYMATLFPQQQWLSYQPFDKTTEAEGKKDAIEAYMYTKLSQSKFKLTIDDLTRDYIEYGNCFGTVEYETSFSTKKETGEEIPLYIGPKLLRISPYDIAFDPTAASFNKTPKIIRSVVSLGDIKDMINSDPTNEYLQEVFSDMLSVRGTVSSSGDQYKGEGYCADGFSDITHYYNTGSVELLTFYGTIFDIKSETLYKDYIITVVDRRRVLLKKENPSWLGSDGIHHVGWRKRPDNLYAMGPLDNLVGLQYRIDHLENLKADVFDAIAAPKYKVVGEVQEWEDKPFERIYIGDGGDVVPLVPDSTALNVDFQIRQLEETMEELAGAPKQAMGIRTAGEKTAFEVQTLDNASSRIYQNKTGQYEERFIEPILNDFLEVAVRNMDTTETILVTDKDNGITIIDTVEKSDLVGKGRLVPVAARHFAERALRLQNLQQLWQIKQGDPSIAAHLSGKGMAKILAEELGEDDLYSENIAVAEGLETQNATQEAEVVNAETSAELSDQGF